ncbi:MAG: hypothetical protein JJU11_16410 [Candidatus Sumerlaeia bacterium]|nr:hypothetical protein [Candidatus Sumerlaeia bacterium]
MIAKLRILGIFCILAVVFTTAVGCKKQRAEITLRKTTQVVADIEQNYDGGDHEPDALSSVKSKVEQATNLLASDASTAFDIANQARSEADLLLERIKPTHADRVFTNAREEIRVADINNLRRIDPERYQRIIQLNNEANEGRTANDWDTVISRGNSIIQEVTSGLAELKARTERMGDEANLALTELIADDGRIYVPTMVNSIEVLIDQGQELYDRERDYGLAQNKYDEAKNTADEARQQVALEKSREGLEAAEENLTVALQEGVENFLPSRFENLLSIYEETLNQYNDGAFDNVLRNIESLLPGTADLVVDTKRLASDDRIQTINNNITQIENGGILEYIPGATDQLRSMRDEARSTRERDTEAAFDEVKGIYNNANEEYRRIRNNFQNVALNYIQSARRAHEITRAVYNEMLTIFDPIEGEMTSEQRAFENQKTARQTQLGQQLREADNQLENANRYLQQGDDFRSAILLAEEVESQSIGILADIYHTVAHNQVIELARLITAYELEGARQYAPEELNRSTATVEDVKAAIRSGSQLTESEARRDQFLLAVQLGAEARADTELMAQRIAGRATEDIQQARVTLSRAESDKTRRFRADLLKQVEDLIERAEGYRQRQELRLAVETAQRAETLAIQAEREAAQLSSQEQIEFASRMLVDAQAAGASLYAGRDVEQARRLLAQSRALFSSENYVQAETLARSSHRRAEAALYKRIDDAEAELATAIAVGGWEYDDRRLADANSRIREAIQRLRERRYEESERLAGESQVIAARLTHDARNHNFSERVRRIKSNLREGESKGLNFFQPEESIAIRHRLHDLENQFSQENYELVMTEIELIEGRLREVLEGTDPLVTTVASQQERRLDHLVQLGAARYSSVEVAHARDNLRFALLDYRRGLYKAAHSNLDNAIKTINVIEGRYRHQAYAAELTELFNEFDEMKRQFSVYLTRGPEEVRNLALSTESGTRALSFSSAMSPTEFREKSERLYVLAQEIEVPRGMEAIHESAIEAFGNVQLAALGFEKFVILDRMDRRTATEHVTQTYMQINRAVRAIGNIQQTLIVDEQRFRRVDGRAAILVRSNP